MDLQDFQGNQINDFITNYRNVLKEQYGASQKALEQQRTNDYTSIMSNANRAGMLYSNFPARDKIKYDTQTFYPAAIKAYQQYQTGLDKIRANSLNLWNQNKAIEEAIADLNAA